MAIINKININNEVYSIISSALYGECSSSAQDYIKQVTLPDSFSLFANATIYIKFNEINEADSLCLKVNNLDQKPIYYQNHVIGASTDELEANVIYQFIYNKNLDVWELTGSINKADKEHTHDISDIYKIGENIFSSNYIYDENYGVVTYGIYGTPVSAYDASGSIFSARIPITNGKSYRFSESAVASGDGDMYPNTSVIVANEYGECLELISEPISSITINNADATHLYINWSSSPDKNKTFCEFILLDNVLTDISNIANNNIADIAKIADIANNKADKEHIHNIEEIYNVNGVITNLFPTQGEAFPTYVIYDYYEGLDLSSYILSDYVDNYGLYKFPVEFGKTYNFSPLATKYTHYASYAVVNDSNICLSQYGTESISSITITDENAAYIYISWEMEDNQFKDKYFGVENKVGLNEILDNKANNEILDTKADKEHTHDFSDIYKIGENIFSSNYIYNENYGAVTYGTYGTPVDSFDYPGEIFSAKIPVEYGKSYKFTESVIASGDNDMYSDTSVIVADQYDRCIELISEPISSITINNPEAIYLYINWSSSPDKNKTFCEFVLLDNALTDISNITNSKADKEHIHSISDIVGRDMYPNEGEKLSCCYLDLPSIDIGSVIYPNVMENYGVFKVPVEYGKSYEFSFCSAIVIADSNDICLEKYDESLNTIIINNPDAAYLYIQWSTDCIRVDGTHGTHDFYDGTYFREKVEFVKIDTELSTESNNPVANSVITNAINSLEFPVDTELSTESENPVQNKVITTELDSKASATTEYKTISGDEIYIDDVSPIEHNVEVKLRSKNLCNPYEFTLGQDWNGTSNPSLAVLNMPCLPNTSYTISWSEEAKSKVKFIVEKTETTATTSNNTIDVNYVTSRVLTTKANTNCICVLVQDTNYSTLIAYDFIESLKMQIELGETATEYTPYIGDFSTAIVTTSGKNLLTAQQVYEGCYLYEETTLDGRNVVRMTSGSTVKKAPIQFKENTQYTVSLETKTINDKATDGNMVFTFFYTDGTYSSAYSNHTITTWKKITATSTEGKTISHIGVTSAQYQIFDYIDIDTFQFEEGSTVTEYEPYKEPVNYTPKADGTIERVTSISPTMIISTNINGVIINCEYISQAGIDLLNDYILKSELPNISDLTSHVNNKSNPHDVTAEQVGALPLNGGTMTGTLTLNGGDGVGASKISLVPNQLGQITDHSTSTLLGFTNSTTFTVGHSSYNTSLRGKETRPTYNNDKIALYSDIPTDYAKNSNTITVTFMSYASGSSDGGGNIATLKVNNEIYTEIKGKSIFKKAQTIVVPAHYMGVTLNLTNVDNTEMAAVYVTIDGIQTTYTADATINLYTDGGEIPQFVLVRLSAGDL